MKIVLGFLKPLQKLIEIDADLLRTLLNNLKPFSLPLNLIHNCIEPAIVSYNDSFKCCATFIRRQLRKLRTE